MLRNLAEVHPKHFAAFLNSFHTIFCDFDGVINDITKQTPLSNARGSLNLLKKHKKNIHVLTNNTTYTSKFFLEKFKFNIDSITTPTHVMIDYLKRTSYNTEKELYVIGSNYMKNELRMAGFKLAEEDEIIIAEDFDEYIANLKNDKEMGCVIIDWDFNVTHVKLLRASVYLKNAEVLYFTGSVEEKLTKGNLSAFGIGFFQGALSKFCNRIPMSFAKPSFHLKDYLFDNFGIKNPSEILLIGDSFKEDMQFAHFCGFQKLLVLSGITTKDEICKINNTDLQPDYYIESLEDLHALIKTAQI